MSAPFWKPGSSQPSSAKPDPKVITSTKSAVPVKPSSSSVVAPKLSKGVLSMKFMKQKESDKGTTQESVIKNMEVVTKSASSILVCSTEHFDFTASLPGRRSFNGCNKAVERHYEQVLDDLNYKRKTSTAKTDTISDKEMLKRYESLIGLPRGPNQGKKPDNRSINKQDIGNVNKRGIGGNSGSKDHSSKKGKFR